MQHSFINIMHINHQGLRNKLNLFSIISMQMLLNRIMQDNSWRFKQNALQLHFTPTPNSTQNACPPREFNETMENLQENYGELAVHTAKPFLYFNLVAFRPPCFLHAYFNFHSESWQLSTNSVDSMVITQIYSQ